MRCAPETFDVRQEKQSNPLSLEVVLLGIVSWVLSIAVLGEKTFFPVFNGRYSVANIK
jgi:hypothetical protein